MARKAKVEEPVKRGRGRPKGSTNKPKDTSAVKVSKRGRGRPKKDDGSGFGAMHAKSSAKTKAKTTAMLTGKRTRGRPKKVAEPVKRGRGRPKNALNKKTMNANWDAFMASNAPAKKKRGRPAKVRTEEVVKTPGKRGRKPGTTKAVIAKRKRAPKVAKIAKLIRTAGKVTRDSEGVKAVGVDKIKRGRGRPKKMVSKNTKAVKHANLFDSAGKVSRRGGEVVPVGIKRGRGRPKGAKDKHPRAKRGSVSGMHSVGKLSNKSAPPQVALAKAPKATQVKMHVHRTPTQKIGKVKSTMGKLKLKKA